MWAFKDLVRGVNRGLAEYYKKKLFKSQFENNQLIEEHKEVLQELAKND